MTIQASSADVRSYRASLERVALALIAVGAEELQVLDRRSAAQSEGQDVVVLEVEGAAASHAFAAIALEHNPTDLDGNWMWAWRYCMLRIDQCVIVPPTTRGGRDGRAESSPAP